MGRKQRVGPGRRGWVAIAGGVGAWAVAGSAGATPPLHVPFPCGTTYTVTNGHHTNTHTGNDDWAWDLGLPVGADVVAPADGVVRLVKMNSSQGGCNSAYANDANYVVIEFGDGTEALLMHLQHQSSNLAVGDVVKQGDVVARVGLTGWACGAHLHFQIQTTCSSWWCQSIKAQFVGFGDPSQGTSLKSNNCPIVEPCAQVLDGGTTVIDETGPCFARKTAWFWTVDEGYQDAHVYTWANDGAEADAQGQWHFAVQADGDYRVEVFVPETSASSQQAGYELHGGNGPTTLPPLDQAAHKGWVDLGVYPLVAGDDRWLRLADNTGEARDLDRQLAFDAVRFSYVDPAAGSDSGGGSEGDSGGAPVDPTTGGSEPAGTDGGSDDAVGGESTDDGDALPAASDGEADGCGCTQTPGGPSPWWALGLFGALGLRRGRRRR